MNNQTQTHKQQTMIFQYTRVLSTEDSKRHYRWECISRNHEHLFVFITPNGTRWPKMILNTPEPKQIVTRRYGPIASFVDLFSTAELAIYHRIVEDMPIVPHILMEQDLSDDDPLFISYFDNNGGKTVFRSLISLVYHCHTELVRIEMDLLELDDENREKHRKDAFWNELTNVLTKIDSTAFLTNCMQQLSKR